MRFPLKELIAEPCICQAKGGFRINCSYASEKELKVYFKVKEQEGVDSRVDTNKDMLI